jgi:hypothetical protein
MERIFSVVIHDELGIFLVVILAFSTFENLDKMNRFEVNLVKLTNEDEALVQSLIEDGKEYFMTCFEVITHKLPVFMIELVDYIDIISSTIVIHSL